MRYTCGSQAGIFLFQIKHFFFLKNATSYIIFCNLFYWFHSWPSSKQCWSNRGVDCNLPCREEKGMRNLLTPLYWASALWVIALGQRNGTTEECCSQGWDSAIFSPAKAPRKCFAPMGHRASSWNHFFPGQAENSQNACDILARPQAMSTKRTRLSLQREQSYNSTSWSWKRSLAQL